MNILSRSLFVLISILVNVRKSIAKVILDPSIKPIIYLLGDRVAIFLLALFHQLLDVLLQLLNQIYLIELLIAQLTDEVEFLPQL